MGNNNNSGYWDQCPFMCFTGPCWDFQMWNIFNVVKISLDPLYFMGVFSEKQL